MMTKSEKLLAKEYLIKLVTINQALCTEDELRLIKEFIEVGEEYLALDEFCAMWEVTNKPKANAQSKDLITKIVKLLNINKTYDI